MPIHIVRLGTPRRRGEGPRLGTVRRPPRGVKKSDFSRGGWFDVWLPELSPSAGLIRDTGILHDHTAWTRFARGYRAEMKRPGAAHLLDTLALLSHSANFAVGCYCEDERFCHRTLLRELLAERGAAIR
jgi:uncharacterized protein YeaO (DUF488 family)